MVEVNAKKEFGVSDLSPALQAAMLAGDGRAHQGFAVKLSPDKRKNTILDCSGLDELAVVTTVALSIQRTGVSTPLDENDTPPVFARVTWGVDGHFMAVECDVVNGTLLAVPASSLRVDVYVDEDSDVDDFAEVTVGAVIGYMPHGGSRAAQRTVPIELAAVGDAPANVVIVPVPAFAKDVTFLVNPTATFRVEQLSDLAATVVLSNIAAVAPAVPPTVVFPISNRTRYLRLTNAGAAALLVSAVFGLAV